MSYEFRRKVRKRAYEIEEESEQPEAEERAPKLTLYDLFRTVAPSDVVAVFGRTGSGKTTLAYILSEDAVNKGIDVFYLDTEGNVHWRLDERVNYYRIKSLEELRSKLYEIKYGAERGEYGKNGLLLIVDSIEAPVLRSMGRSMASRTSAMVERVHIIDYIKAMCERLSVIERGEVVRPVNALIVKHMRTEIGLTRILERALTEEAETEERAEEGRPRKVRRIITPEEVPLEVRLAYINPTGGRDLYLLKEIWVCDIAKTVNKPDGYRLTQCNFYAWRSRCFGKLENIFNISIETVPEAGKKTVVISYEILSYPAPLMEVKPRIVAK